MAFSAVDTLCLTMHTYFESCCRSSSPGITRYTQAYYALLTSSYRRGPPGLIAKPEHCPPNTRGTTIFATKPVARITDQLKRGCCYVKRLVSRRMMSVSTTFSQGADTAATRERTCYVKLAFLSLDRAVRLQPSNLCLQSSYTDCTNLGAVVSLT